MTSAKAPSPLSGRTKIITAASITAVALASVFAIAANLGILSSANQTKVGTVTAAGDLLPVRPGAADADTRSQTSAEPRKGAEGTQATPAREDHDEAEDDDHGHDRERGDDHEHEYEGGDFDD
jgi:hypothetical protein